jgi:hypothetical protein
MSDIDIENSHTGRIAANVAKLPELLHSRD